MQETLLKWPFGLGSDVHGLSFSIVFRISQLECVFFAAMLLPAFIEGQSYGKLRG